MKKLLVLGVLLAGLASAATAEAARGDGATVTDESYCIASPFATWCWDIQTVTKLTATPSGNTAYMTNGTVDYRVTLPLSGCTQTKTTPLHVNWLKRGDEVQSRSERHGETTSFVCASGLAYTCTSSFELHEANGEVQFQRFDFTCTSD